MRFLFVVLLLLSPPASHAFRLPQMDGFAAGRDHVRTWPCSVVFPQLQEAYCPNGDIVRANSAQCPQVILAPGLSSANLTAANDKTILSAFILVLSLAAMQISSDTLLMLPHTGGPRRGRRHSPASYDVFENFGMEATFGGTHRVCISPPAGAERAALGILAVNNRQQNHHDRKEGQGGNCRRETEVDKLIQSVT